jgi:hypothetical protein
MGFIKSLGYKCDKIQPRSMEIDITWSKLLQLPTEVIQGANCKALHALQP